MLPMRCCVGPKRARDNSIMCVLYGDRLKAFRLIMIPSPKFFQWSPSITMPIKGRHWTNSAACSLRGGRLFILINLYKDNHYSLRWVSELKVSVHARSEAEYIEMLQQHGFESVEARRIPDRSPSPNEYSGKWFKNAEELKDFKRIGALLLIGTKRGSSH